MVILFTQWCGIEHIPYESCSRHSYWHDGFYVIRMVESYEICFVKYPQLICYFVALNMLIFWFGLPNDRTLSLSIEISLFSVIFFPFSFHGYVFVPGTIFHTIYLLMMKYKGIDANRKILDSSWIQSFPEGCRCQCYSGDNKEEMMASLVHFHLLITIIHNGAYSAPNILLFP